jgi:hypothetical protein
MQSLVSMVLDALSICEHLEPFQRKFDALILFRKRQWIRLRVLSATGRIVASHVVR